MVDYKVINKFVYQNNNCKAEVLITVEQSFSYSSGERRHKIMSQYLITAFKNNHSLTLTLQMGCSDQKVRLTMN